MTITNPGATARAPTPRAMNASAPAAVAAAALAAAWRSRRYRRRRGKLERITGGEDGGTCVDEPVGSRWPRSAYPVDRDRSMLDRCLSFSVHPHRLGREECLDPGTAVDHGRELEQLAKPDHLTTNRQVVHNRESYRPADPLPNLDRTGGDATTRSGWKTPPRRATIAVFDARSCGGCQPSSSGAFGTIAWCRGSASSTGS